MKKRSILIILIFSFNSLPSQDFDRPMAQKFIEGNNIRAMILNGGDLFWDSDEGQFFPVNGAPPNNPPVSIFASSIWLGGINGGGDLSLAAQTYGRFGNNFDFAPGPLKANTGTPYTEFYPHFDNIWSVKRTDIEEHLADFEDNGVIDNPNWFVINWPGDGNPYIYQSYQVFLLYTPQGWAPFFDRDNDGIYDPYQGDYPHPPHVIPELHPEMMTWCVFNDNREHTQTGGNPLRVEIQLTNWLFDCFDQYIINNTLFGSYKIINRSAFPIDSLYSAIWTDFNIGCYQDDFSGSIPTLDAVFGYNQDNVDGYLDEGCPQGLATFGENPPAQSVTSLNRPLHKTMVYIGAGAPSAAVSDPANTQEYYNYLTGRWRDGTPLSEGGDGYLPTGIPANFAFPGNPNDPSSWSLFGQDPTATFNPRAVASHYFGNFLPGDYFTWDVAYTYHRQPGYNHLENVDRIHYDVSYLRQMYGNQFNSFCNGVVTEVEEEFQSSLLISPNPASQNITIDWPENMISNLLLYDLTGQLQLEHNIEETAGPITLGIHHLPKGTYFLKIRSQYVTKVKKIVLQ